MNGRQHSDLWVLCSLFHSTRTTPFCAICAVVLLGERVWKRAHVVLWKDLGNISHCESVCIHFSISGLNILARKRLWALWWHIQHVWWTGTVLTGGVMWGMRAIGVPYKRRKSLVGKSDPETELQRGWGLYYVPKHRPLPRCDPW